MTELVAWGLVFIFYMLGAFATMMLFSDDDEHFSEHPRRKMLEITATWWLIIMEHMWRFVMSVMRGPHD